MTLKIPNNPYRTNAAMKWQALADKRPKKYTVREHQPSPKFKQWIFPPDVSKFYYCHVFLDWVTVELTPPDVFAMTYEAGLSIVGISNALDTYISMLNSGQWAFFLPHFYFDFNCPDKYKTEQQNTFDTLATFSPLIAEDLYMNGYYIARAGGGISFYVALVADWFSQLSVAEVQCLNVLEAIYKSKEFTFIEYDMNDPTYGKLMFNNVTYADKNNYQSNDPDEWMGVNWNIINPQRFERWMRPYITNKYDVTTKLVDIYKANGITENNTAYDYLSFVQGEGDVVSGGERKTQPILQEVSFSWNISEQRERSNLILEYTNKPYVGPNSEYQDATTEYWVIKEATLNQFFRSASWFIWQAVITNYLYDTFLLDSGKTVTNVKQLWPPKFTQDEYKEFTHWQMTTYKYGKPLQSGVGNYVKSKLTDIGSETGSSGSSGQGLC